MGSVLVSGLVAGAIYGILALGIVVVYRGSRVLNFAQAEIGTFGLYISWSLVQRGLPWIVGLLGGLVAAGAIGALFERFVVRPMADSSRVTVAVATIGLLLLLISVEGKIWGLGEPRGIDGPIDGTPLTILGWGVSWTELSAFVIAAAVGFGLNVFLRKTDFGLGVLAAAQDAVAVRMMGVSYARVSQFTWVAGAVLAALGIILIAPTIGAFLPGHFSVGANAIFVPALVAALVARLDNLTHAFLAGLAVGVIRAFVDFNVSSASLPGVSSLAIFLVLVAALLFRAPVAQTKGEAA